MSFYSDASLVLIPSGYKDQKVYCAVPTDGSGDLTFSRASNATRVASNGLIDKVRTNLLLQSNTFDTTWTQQNTTLTSGQAGYDGSNDAWKVEAATTSTTRIYQSSSIAANTLITISLYAKVGNVDFIRFNFLTSGTNSSVVFDLTDGTTYSSTAIDTTWESVGSGWVRIAATFVNSDAITESRIEVRSDYTSLSCDAGSFVYIQDAQLETGDVATDYIATTSAEVSVGPVSGLPRLDYLNSSCPRLLLEPAATALNQFSEQLDNAYWTGSAVVTANTTISPDGYQSADTLNDNTTAYLDKRRLISITPNATHTFSFFVKKTTGSLTHYAGMGALLTGGTTVVDYGIINTTTGAINRDASSTINSVSYSSVSYGDYWRVIMTFTDNQSNPNCTIIIYPAISSNGTSISSNAQGSNVFWGVNLTQSAYATSYIPTLGTSVTRVADSASKTGISSLIGQTEGTVMVEYDQNLIGQSATRRIFALSDGTTSNRITAYIRSTNVIEFYVRNSGGDLFLAAASSPAGNTKGVHKIAAAYKNGDYAVYLDGSLIISGAGTAGTIPACSRFDLGNQLGANDLYEPMMQALLFKTRLSNSDLATLTA